jgi:uncharacterized membrane protein YdjX (TVP38/TMEM64 family)
VKKYKLVLKIIWISIIAAALLSYVFFPNFFKAESLSSLMNNNAFLIAFIYITLSCIRSLFFIPSTVFVIMGLALYPSQPIFVITVNLVGILIGGLLLYGAAQFLTEEALFSPKKQAMLNNVKSKMNEYGFPIVLFWSFFPAVPTDIICFIAGAIRMKLLYFIAGLLIGEAILISLYVYSGKSLVDFFF